MRPYVVPICGGLGDTFLQVLNQGDCGYVEDLKRREPDAKVHCILMSTCPASFSVVSNLFDGVVYEPWDGDRTRFVRLSEGERFNREGLTWTRPEIALSPQEKEKLDLMGDFIALHPFAGTSNRDWSALVDLKGLVNLLCDQGHRVALLGGSSMRYEGHGRDRVLKEEVDFQRPGLINLVGTGSVNLQANAAMRARCFIGSFSSYHCAVFGLKTPKLILGPSELRGFFETPHPVYGVMGKRPCTALHYFDQGEIANRIASYAKDFL